MPSVFDSLNIGSESLSTSRHGIDTAAHNIANAQTDGYSRQRVEVKPRDPTLVRGALIGGGAYLSTVRRSHDAFLEKQINKSNSSLAESETKKEIMFNLEDIFNPELNSTISKELSAFFSSLNTLATIPDDLSARTAVKEQGKNLAAAFGRIDDSIRQTRQDLNDSLLVSLEDVNNVMQNLAQINVKIKGLELEKNSNANDLRDEKDRLVQKLSSSMQINYYEDQNGMLTVRGPGEILLIDGGRAAKFAPTKDQMNDGLYKIIALDSEGQRPLDVTHQFESGKIKAILDVRDIEAKEVLDRNNEMAWTFGNKFNQVHQLGFGINDHKESTGIDFFDPLTDERYAARDLRLSDAVINSTDIIAASSLSNSPGDNINVTRMISVSSEPLFNEGVSNLSDYYANYVGKIGIAARRADHIFESNKILQTDWISRKDSVSGVSLDEEATDLIRWQTAFTASSKVITTVDEMLETILGLKR